MKGNLFALGFFASCMVALYLFLKAVVAVDCWMSWSDSTMEYRTRMLTCQVKHPTMGWIPESRVRGTD